MASVSLDAPLPRASPAMMSVGCVIRPPPARCGAFTPPMVPVGEATGFFIGSFGVFELPLLDELEPPPSAPAAPARTSSAAAAANSPAACACLPGVTASASAMPKKYFAQFCAMDEIICPVAFSNACAKASLPCASA